MRKYLLFIISFVSLVFFFSFQSPPIAQAVDGSVAEGGECNSLALTGPDKSCMKGYTCQTDSGVLSSPIGKCVRAQSDKPQATCHCVGKGTSGENNFECEMNGQKGTAYCGSTQDQCYDDPGKPLNSGASKQEGALFGTSVEMVGVQCRKPEALCKCEHPGEAGDGRNGFSCTRLGQTDRDFCDNVDMACQDDPNSVLKGGAGSEEKIFGGNLAKELFTRGIDIKGVVCVQSKAPTLPPPPSPPCLQWGDKGKCTQVQTAFGPFATDPSQFITTIFGILLSFSGGVALLLIIKSGYQLMTSAGKPEQVQAGRDQLIAAIVGLLFLVFSLVLLQVIGVDILRIYGFG